VVQKWILKAGIIISRSSPDKRLPDRSPHFTPLNRATPDGTNFTTANKSDKRVKPPANDLQIIENRKDRKAAWKGD
jgi:hypothetical protein